jgi:hypothetical protein
VIFHFIPDRGYFPHPDEFWPNIFTRSPHVKGGRLDKFMGKKDEGGGEKLQIA